MHQIKRDPVEEPLVAYDSDDGPFGAFGYVDTKTGTFQHIGDFLDVGLPCAGFHYDDHINLPFCRITFLPVSVC